MSLVLNSLDPTFGYKEWEILSNPDVFMLQESGDGRLVFERLWAARLDTLQGVRINGWDSDLWNIAEWRR